MYQIFSLEIPESHKNMAPCETTMTAKFKPVTHVIFDMDGLILDTERHYSTVNQKVLDKFGPSSDRKKLEFTWDVKKRMMGRKTAESAQVFLDHYKLPITVDQYLEETQKSLMELLPTAELMPGAERLIKHLAANQVPMCVCTGSTRFNFGLKTKRHQHVFQHFQHIVCSPDEPDVKQGKPAPDVFLVGASRFRPEPADPEKVLVFEDAVNGVQAALTARMQVVLVPDPRMSEDDRRPATVCLNSLTEFQPEWFGLPPYN